MKVYNKDDVAIKKLNDMQRRVTQENGTEPAFRNEFHNSKAEGLYVDIVLGEPLFTSADKFDSNCGWLSFTKPLEQDHVTEHVDQTNSLRRTEVRSKYGDSHLGHVFPDGPKAQGGLRYCINSASLRFIPKDRLEQEGYGEYLREFEGKTV